MSTFHKFILGPALFAVLFLMPLSARADDDLEKWAADLNHREQKLKLKEKRVELDRKEAMIEQRAQAIKDGRWMEEQEDRRGYGRDGWRGHHEWKGHEGRGEAWRCPFWKKFLFYLGMIHIMLAVIVFKDLRSATPRMNGLWVIVVLMGGLPATVAYAVFRLVMAKSAA